MHLPYRTAHDVPLILAPMAGVSEAPFRQLCRRFGADAVVSEFISAVGVSLGLERVLRDLRFEPCERPIGIQLYGADPEVMARAAGMVTELAAPDFIDINFGCPVKKVVRNNGGSGCLKDLGLVERIIRAVRAATHLPVTVKIRSGWDEATRDPVGVALRCQDAGALALTLHPRTRTQMYAGEAAWDEIAALVRALGIPVIGNGDVRTAEDAVAMRRHTGCAGIMIARGSFGNPWIFSRARSLLDGRPAPAEPGAGERLATALDHARGCLDATGPQPRPCLFVTGPRGIGKTRLLEEAKHHLQLEGTVFLTGAAFADDPAGTAQNIPGSFRLRGDCGLVSTPDPLPDPPVRSCVHLAWLDGVFDTTRNEVRIRVPLNLAVAPEIRPGAVIDNGIVDVSVQVVVSNATTSNRVLQITPYTIPQREVLVGIVPSGAPPAFTHTATVTGFAGNFSATVDRSELGSGEHDVWVRACLGANCDESMTTITL